MIEQCTDLPLTTVEIWPRSHTYDCGNVAQISHLGLWKHGLSVQLCITSSEFPLLSSSEYFSECEYVLYVKIIWILTLSANTLSVSCSFMLSANLIEMFSSPSSRLQMKLWMKLDLGQIPIAPSLIEKWCLIDPSILTVVRLAYCYPVRFCTYLPFVSTKHLLKFILPNCVPPSLY